MTDRTYWHGGACGRLVGDEIVPAGELPELPTVYDLPEYEGDRTRVYITADQALARGYASDFNRPDGGALYKVEPLGELVEDPDYAGQDVCWSAGRARVVEVVETHPEMTRAEHIKSNAAYMNWKGGGPMYDNEGHMLPSPEMRQGGVRPDQLRSVGTWVSWEVMRQAVAVAGRTWAEVGTEVKRIVRNQEIEVRSIRGRRQHQHP